MGVDREANRAAARVAVVTGVAQGIGRAVAEVLAHEGYALVLADLREPAQTLAAVRDAGAEGAVVGDVASEGYVAGLTGQVRERFGRVDVLFNNAGVSLLTRPRTPQPSSGDGSWRSISPDPSCCPRRWAG